MRLTTNNDILVSSKPEILGEVESFYGQLYTTVQTPVEDLAKDPRAKLTRDFSLYEISVSLKQLKNSKACVNGSPELVNAALVDPNELDRRH
ncbi:jg2007 [Pararge aegeria aegeria]|uniref:Jg2007 protein n=1 Tax=Pararge aegeria aegeria TaxID=348720 RepID=A0A8S4SAU0_9NEOP|nr:jg2007 [Pararge aegeria aegeria]